MPETIHIDWTCLDCQRRFPTVETILDGKIDDRRCPYCLAIMIAPELVTQPEPQPTPSDLIGVRTEPVTYSNVKIERDSKGVDKPTVHVYHADAQYAAEECVRLYKYVCAELAEGNPITSKQV